MSTNPNEEINNIIKSARGAARKDKRAQVRRTAQQVLLYLGQTIARGNQRYYTSPTPTPPNLPQITANSHEEWVQAGSGRTSLQQGWKSGYRNIVPIEKTGPAPDGFTDLVGMGTEITKFFTFELTAVQQAALYPKIRLFKVEYEVDEDTGEILNNFKPTKPLREIIFDKAITTDEISILEQRGGNLGSSGIESFEWALKGVNPAEIDSNIEASLKIYFNNIGVFQNRIDKLIEVGDSFGVASDLQEVADTTGYGPYQDLADEATAAARELQQGVNKKAHFMDLITFAPPTTTTTAQLPCIELYQPYFFEVMAEVGWEVPDSSKLKLFTPKQRKFIENQTIKLYLTLTDHKFDFKQDGSATLTANYRARHSLADAENDILYPSDEYAEKLARQNKVVAERQQAVAGRTATDSETEEIDQAINARRNLLRANYRQLIGHLLDGCTYEAEIPNALLLTNVTDDNQPMGRGLTTPEYRRAGGASTLTYREFFDILGRVGDSTLVEGVDETTDTELLDAVDRLLKAWDNRSNITIQRKYFAAAANIMGGNELGTLISRVLLDPENSSMDESQVGDIGGWTEISIESDITFKEDGFSKIQFLYLGDILETVMETVPITTAIANKRLCSVTTDTFYDDIYSFMEEQFRDDNTNAATLQQFDMSKLRCAELGGSQLIPRKVINFANIPVELSAFLDFFAQKVVAQDKENYYLNSFLADLFNDLVRPALGTNSILGVPSDQPAIVNIDISAVDTERGFMWDSTLTEQFYGEVGFDVMRSPTIPRRAYRTAYLPEDAPENEYVWIGTVDYYKTGTEMTPILSDHPAFYQNPPTDATGNAATVKILGIARHGTTLSGDYEENTRNGIANFIVGLDRGIIKDVAFERVDQPYLPEARVAQDKSFGLGQLRELYHVNLTLYGNNILKPGQMIYVEPNRLIFGRPTDRKSVARILGLGGYHLVVDVSHTIGLDGWETSVKALHMAMPAKNESNIGGVITIEDEGNPEDIGGGGNDDAQD